MSSAIQNLLTVTIFSSVMIIASQSRAYDGFICNGVETCNQKGIYTKQSPAPTKGDRVRLNPAAVPVEKVTGVESLYYKGSFDFSLVKGFGRIGAAISPSNNEETFFGPPALEDASSYEARLRAREKFQSQKYSLATAVGLISSKGSGLGNVDVSLGVMGRWNKESGQIHPGGGLLAIVGPVLLGGSYYQDDSNVTDSVTGQTVNYASQVTTLSAGLSLESFMLDYSVLTVAGSSTTTVVTLTGFLGRSILTLSRRDVNSLKPGFDFSANSATSDIDKIEYFGGAQYRVAPFLVLGVFYNYYLLHDISLGATLFF